MASTPVRLLLLAISLAAIWLLMSGHFEPLLLGMGTVSVLLVVWLSSRMGIVDEEGFPIAAAGRAVGYVPWLLKEVVAANLAVARRILSPRLNTQPSVVMTEAPEGGDVARTLYANSITLTPSTVTIEVSDDVLLVHALTEDAANGLRDGEMLRRVERVARGSA